MWAQTRRIQADCRLVVAAVVVPPPAAPLDGRLRAHPATALARSSYLSPAAPSRPVTPRRASAQGSRHGSRESLFMGINACVCGPEYGWNASLCASAWWTARSVFWPRGRRTASLRGAVLGAILFYITENSHRRHPALNAHDTPRRADEKPLSKQLSQPLSQTTQPKDKRRRIVTLIVTNQQRGFDSHILSQQ